MIMNAKISKKLAIWMNDCNSSNEKKNKGNLKIYRSPQDLEQ